MANIEFSLEANTKNGSAISPRIAPIACVTVLNHSSLELCNRIRILFFAKLRIIHISQIDKILKLKLN